MAEKKNGFAGGADGAEADFEDIAKTGFPVPLAPSAEAVDEVFDPLYCSVNCKSIFSWGFLKHKVTEIRSNPLSPVGCTIEDHVGVHACRL